MDAELEVACREMASDEARESKALAWSEGLIGDGPMNLGDVRWVAFDPAVGGEIRKTHPAAEVSNELLIGC